MTEGMEENCSQPPQSPHSHLRVSPVAEFGRSHRLRHTHSNRQPGPGALPIIFMSTAAIQCPLETAHDLTALSCASIAGSPFPGYAVANL